MIKLTRIFFIVFTIVTLTGVGFFASKNYANASIFERNEKQDQNSFAELSGFKPDTIVSYKVSPQASKAVFSSDKIDLKGGLNIEFPKDLNESGSEITYDFTVEENDQTLRLQFHFNAEKGTASISGTGAGAFSDIEISTGRQNILTRADWSGLFEETGIRLHDDENETPPIQVAFYSRNSAHDAQNHVSPSIIKVQPVAPIIGGGLRTAEINANYVQPLQLMAEQLTVVAMQQIAIIGTFFDAKEQLEAQRTHQSLKAEAIKDYHPSDQMCRIGSYMRSLANAEIKMGHDHLVLSDVLLSKYTNQQNMSTYLGGELDVETRIQQYARTYCDPRDNDSGLDVLCDYDGLVPTPPGAINPRRVNKDVDFARTVEYPFTMDINFTDDQLTDDEEDVIALGRNLYWTRAFSHATDEELNQNSEYFMQSREFSALAGLAHNSFTKLVSMKASSPAPPPGVQPGWSYMKTMMREIMAIPPGGTAADRDNEINRLVGERPSYYAQMDVLTKKLYQSPNFYTNLYDKPVNIERINTSLEAIRLMQLRDHYDAALRREMLLSGLVENQIYTDAEKIQGILENLK